MLGAITVRSVSKTFSTEGTVALEALREVSVEILPGQFVAFVGPSGCGKSTLLKLIGGLLEPSSGQITVGASQVTGPSRGIGVMFQTPVLFTWRTVLENVLLPVEVFGLERRAATEKARDILRLVGLEGRAKHFPRQLSGGEEQRVAIARAIVADPTLLVADEPTGDLDAKNAAEILTLLKRLNEELKKTVLMVTHDPHAAERAHLIYHLDKGVLQS